MSKIINAKLNRTIQSEDSDIFMKESKIEILTDPDELGIVEIRPLDAIDGQGNPFAPNDQHIYAMKLEKDDYTIIEEYIPKKSFSFSAPGFDKDSLLGEEDDAVKLALQEAPDNGEFILDRHGYIIDKRGEKVKMKIIDLETMKDAKDVKAWVFETAKKGFKKEAILEFANFYFDDDWYGIAKEATSEFFISPEDRSQTEKAPAGQGTMPKKDTQDNTEHKKGIPQGKIEGGGSGGGDGKKPTMSQEEGSDVSNRWSFKRKEDTKEKKVKEDKVAFLLRRISFIKKMFGLNKYSREGEEEMKKGTDDTLSKGHP